MVGLKSWMLWLGWFLHAFLPNFVSVILIVILMKVPMWGIDTPPIEYCNTGVFFVFLFLYLVASITFCFAISSLFGRREYISHSLYIQTIYRILRESLCIFQFMLKMCTFEFKRWRVPVFLIMFYHMDTKNFIP